jgi:Secretion system C-terminal sorting domain/Fibronectin type III domain
MRNLIILLFYFCIPLALVANFTNPPVPFETANIDKTEELLCTLPAPASISFPYSAANNNTTSIAVSWSNVANAVNYNVATYVTASGAFVSNTVVTTTSTTITSLSPGTCYTFYVSAGCGGGAFSPNNISGAACTDFVIDLIANGYQNCSPTQQVFHGSVGASTNITINTGVVYAGVVKQTFPTPTNPPAQKNIRFLITSPSEFTMQQVPAPQGAPELGNLVALNCALTADNLEFASIKSCNPDMLHCKIKFGVGNLGSYIMSISDHNDSIDYSITVYRTGCTFGGGGNGRTTMDDVSLANEITVAPNPFNDEFNLIIPGIEEMDQSVSIQLFDMNGKICHAQELAPRTTSDVIRIPSSNLPAGIYFLRARVGDTVKTIKVMKNDQ